MPGSGSAAGTAAAVRGGGRRRRRALSHAASARPCGVALEALRANKLRSFLTMLGIVIGVAAVIAMVALGRGAQKSVNERIAALGTTLLTVIPGQARGARRRGLAGRTAPRSPWTTRTRSIERRATHIAAVQPEMSRPLQVQYENQNTNTTVDRRDRELPRGAQVQASRRAHVHDGRGRRAPARRRARLPGRRRTSASGSPRR